jgi:uncharacterized protein with PQ loop repeat
MSRFSRVILTILFFAALVPYVRADLIPPDLLPQDTMSLLAPKFHRSEIVGFLAGLGTTFAAVPDLLAMLKRRSTAGMNPRMAAIMGVFQVLWIYYGLLIHSRPVIAWNLIAVLINSFLVGAYRYFLGKEKARAAHA